MADKSAPSPKTPAPFAKGDRVIISYPGAGWFHEKNGTIRRIEWRDYRSGKRRAGWWATVAADLPPHLTKAECDIHTDHLSPEGEHVIEDGLCKVCG